MQSEFNKGSTNGFGWPWIVLALAFAGTMVLGPAQAATLTVINTNDSGAGSLRQAIADATGGDAITFDSTLAGSTITLTSGQLELDKDLSIEGDLNSDGLPDVTVSGNDTSRVFFVSDSAVASFEGLVITAGRAFEGGGIHNEGTLRLSNSTVSGNEAPGRFGFGGGGIGGSGGGISNSGGTMTLTNSTVSGNEALRGIGTVGGGGSGGGIFNREGTVTLTNSTVSGNSGGGIDNSEGTITLTNSTVSGNSGGGGILSENSGTLTLTNSTVSGNQGGFGGGITNFGGTVAMTNSTVSSNKGSSGGGIDNSEGTITLTNSTVSGNSGGGGILNSGTLTLTNSTVSGNQGRFGGGITNFGGTVAMTNSTVSGNETSPPPPFPPPMGRSGGIFNAESGLLKIVNTIIANSITDGVEEGDCENNGTLDTANSANNLIETGCDVVATLTDDPELGPLQDNGGPTATHALMLGSPAIDFIPVADCEVTEDQRGLSRPQGFSCDIGAFEREVIPIPPGPPAPVPAAGKWALGMLAALLLSAMVALDRRRRRHLKG